MSSQPSRTLQDRLDDAFAEAWRPSLGDKLVGVVTGIDVRHSDYGDPYPIVTVQRDDGTEAAFHGFHTVARRELAKQKPQIGDEIGIAYLGKGEPTKPGVSGAELYRIIVERAEPQPINWDALADVDDADTPAAPAAAAATATPDDDIPFFPSIDNGL